MSSERNRISVCTGNTISIRYAGMPHLDSNIVREMTIRRKYHIHIDHDFSYREAVAVARQQQRKFPRWYVCGSLALMVAGHIPIRRMADVDFCTSDVFISARGGGIPGLHRATFHLNLTDHEKNYYHLADEKEGWCLFIHKELKIEHGTFQGLHLQKIEDVLYWKRQFNRDKDLVDLQLLPDELFEI